MASPIIGCRGSSRALGPRKSWLPLAFCCMQRAGLTKGAPPRGVDVSWEPPPDWPSTCRADRPWLHCVCGVPNERAYGDKSRLGKAWQRGARSWRPSTLYRNATDGAFWDGRRRSRGLVFRREAIRRYWYGLCIQPSFRQLVGEPMGDSNAIIDDASC